MTYWYRAWVAQELRANRRLVLQCGQTSRLVENIDQLSPFLWTKDIALYLLSDATNCPELNQVIPIFDMPKFALELRRHHHIVRCLTTDAKTRQCISGDMENVIIRSLEKCFVSNMPRAADPRDYVYARLGWSEGFSALALKPQYDMSTEDVFTSTTVDVLRSTRSWSQLHFFKPSASPFLPSWAIDFSSLSEPDRHDFSSAWFTAVKGNFRADSNAKFKLRRGRPGLLVTGGFVMDNVAAIAPSYCRVLDTPCGPGKQGTSVKDTMVRLFEFFPQVPAILHQQQQNLVYKRRLWSVRESTIRGLPRF